MTKRLWVALLLGLGTAAPLGAQQKKDEPEFAKYLIAPEIVLKYAGQIGLKPAQRTALTNEVKRVQGEMAGLQVDMAEPAEVLTGLVQKTTVDEAAALAQVDKILTLERDIKKLQMSFLVRIKNLLTPEQQAKLISLRDKGPGTEGGSDDDAR